MKGRRVKREQKLRDRRLNRDGMKPRKGVCVKESMRQR